MRYHTPFSPIPELRSILQPIVPDFCLPIGGISGDFPLASDGTQVVTLVIEWLSHKEYERRFRY